MTKYSKKALDAAEDSVAFSHPFTNRAIATAVFDTLTRAPWWEEVEVGYEFQPGEPGRYESDRGVSERATPGGHLPIIAAERGTYFRDTRWQPPVKPLKVGDLIDTEEQAESLPVGTIAVTKRNAVFRKEGIGAWQQVNEEIYQIGDREMAGQGDRIIYLPRGDFNE